MQIKEGSLEIAKKLGLTEREYNKIVSILKRMPNEWELMIYATLWSEEISLKSSRKFLHKLPKKGKKIIEGKTKYIDIGNDLVCAFDVESSNHLTAKFPLLGAVNAFAGNNRNVYTKGARPVAALNSLRLGEIQKDKTRFFIQNIARGISDASKTLGIPVVGGEVFFNDSYNDNPIVNILSAGIARKNEMHTSSPPSSGNPVFLIGSKTMKDPVSTKLNNFEIENFDDHKEERLKELIFNEKLLQEAALELVSLQIVNDMETIGKGGLINTAAIMATNRLQGFEIDLQKIPCEQELINKPGLLFSETPGRILLIAEKGNEQQVHEIMNKWDLTCAQIGITANNSNLLISKDQQEIVDIPVLSLTHFELSYDKYYKEPDDFSDSKSFNVNSVNELPDLKQAGWYLIKHQNVASKKWLIDQFDSPAMYKKMPSDAAVIPLKGTDKSLVLGVDCNSRYVNANPQQGAAIAVSEAARNIVCSGAKPHAVAVSLNFGNIDDSHVFWQFVEVIKGINKVCRKFELPVVSMNLSFNNQSYKQQKTIYPTPVIGMLGVINKGMQPMTLHFKNKGDMIYLVGESRNDINSSLYLKSYRRIRKSPAPFYSLESAYQLQKIIQELIKNQYVNSAHDVSNGGVFITLIEAGIPLGFGFDITTDAEIRNDAFLFGESQNRIVVTVSAENETDFIDYMIERDFPFFTLGHVTKGEIRVDDESWGYIDQAKQNYYNALEQKLGVKK